MHSVHPELSYPSGTGGNSTQYSDTIMLWQQQQQQQCYCSGDTLGVTDKWDAPSSPAQHRMLDSFLGRRQAVHDAGLLVQLELEPTAADLRAQVRLVGACWAAHS